MQTTDEQAVYQVAPAVPHNRDAEESVIGSILIDPDVYHECRIHIGSRDEFYIDRHKMIWDGLERMFANHVPVDLLTLTDELDNLGTLHEVGGPAYLTALVSRTPSSLNAAAYAVIVHGHYTRRRMLLAANEIAAIAYNETIPLADGVSKATHALSQAAATTSNPQTHKIVDSLKRTDAKLEERSKMDVLPGIPTGLMDLDSLLGGGAQDSDLILILGRPGEGKTSLVLQIMRHAAKHKSNQRVVFKRVVLFSLEMPEEQVVLRLIAQMTGIDYQELRSGKIPQSKVPDYINALDEISQMDIIIDNTPAASPAYIKSLCEILNAEQELDAVFVDSLNLMRSGMNFRKTHEEVDYNATELKNLALQLNVPVYAAHQMSRSIEYRGKNSRPQLSDMREGGEQPADIAIFIYHEVDQETEKIKGSELVIAKHRNGPTGSVAVVFRGAQTKFESAFKVRS